MTEQEPDSEREMLLFGSPVYRYEGQEPAGFRWPPAARASRLLA